MAGVGSSASAFPIRFIILATANRGGGQRFSILTKMVTMIVSEGMASPAPSRWMQWAEDVLRGEPLGADQAEEILRSSDEELLDVIAAAYRLRRHYFGNDVQLYFLVNAKSGLCPEDCNYCSQSKISKAPIPKYKMLSTEQLLAGAQAAAERQSKTYCLVISGRAPTERELQCVEEIVPKIKAQYDLKVCACLGLLNVEQAQRLKQCGVDRVNHNLNTSDQHYEKICTTHGYQDRVATLQAVREAGLELCSGGIMGMGESPTDLVAMAMELRRLQVESIPLNFLHQIPGTPLEEVPSLRPQDCLRGLCMMRFVNPSSELRIAGGREKHLRSLQPLGLYVANSIFVGDYLTTKGQLPEADYQMIEDLGFRIVRQETPVEAS
ncbi:MAG: biotin synthase [Pirellulaceae bacterium]|nr:MAG: biotin synthase [Pirellulaceae bacterium]